MNPSNSLQTNPVHSASIWQRMLQGAARALILIVIFLAGVDDPDPAWGKFWMVQPLIIVPCAGAMGGVIYYFLDHMRRQARGRMDNGPCHPAQPYRLPVLPVDGIRPGPEWHPVELKFDQSLMLTIPKSSSNAEFVNVIDLGSPFSKLFCSNTFWSVTFPSAYIAPPLVGAIAFFNETSLSVRS